MAGAVFAVAAALTAGPASVAYADNVPGNSTVVAVPTSVFSDGSHSTTITVTLGSNGGLTDTVSIQGEVANTAVINGGTAGAAASEPASGGVATFTVTDATTESVTFQATDVTDGIQTITQTATVSFFEPTVTFNSNGGTGSMSPEASFTSQALTTNAYTRAGYTFAGWNTAANGSGTSYLDGASYPFITNATLYAVWSDVTEASGFPNSGEVLGGNTLNVTLQHAGDLVIISSQIHSQSITVSSVSDPNTGSWQRAESFVDPATPGITEEIWWAVATATGASTITVNYSTPITGLSPELVSDSYTASGEASWNFIAGGGAAGTTSTTIDFPAVTSSAVSNQIYWGYAESRQTAAVGSSPGFTYWLTNSLNIVTHNTALDTSTQYVPTALESPASTSTAIAAIFAESASPNITVTFNANGGSGTMSNQTQNTPTALTADTFTFTGHTFAGWNTVADGSGTAYANSAIYPFTVAATLYAQWAIDYNEVTFNANGGSGTMSSEFEPSNTPTALTTNSFTFTGHTFTGWNTAANGSGTAYADGAIYPFTISVTLYAQWAVNTITVTFNANGGAGTMSAEVEPYSTATALTANTFTFTGHTFTGWNTVADGSGTAYAAGATYPFTANATLYAQWMVNPSFTVTFDANGGVGTMSAETENVPTALTANAFSWSGHAFTGWNTAADGLGTSYADGATYSFTASATLYAQWKANALPKLHVKAGNVVAKSGHTYQDTAVVTAGLKSGDTAKVVHVTFVYVGVGATKYHLSTIRPQAPGTYRVTLTKVVVAVSPKSHSHQYSSRFVYIAGQLVITR